MEINKMNIFQKMSAITDEIGKVAKNITVGIGQNKYKAVSEVDVLNAVKPAEIKYGVYSYPASREIIDNSIIANEKVFEDLNKNTKTIETKSSLFLRIKTTYRFINTDKPDEFIEITTYGDGIDTQDKATGKAMTYADKYALLKAYKIETGDDPDQQANEPLEKVEPTAQKTATPKQVEILAKNYIGENLEKLLKINNITSLEEMPMEKASELITKIYKRSNSNNE